MVGANSKNRKGASVHVNYLIHIQEIKPWPPSQSLRSLRSVLIQWENGDRNSGSTDTVVPTLGPIVGEGKIEFNESFRLPVTLLREISGKCKDADSFQKNYLEFNLCEPRRDKIQVLATAVIDLADCGVVKEIISVSAPMNSNRSFRNTSQPVLYIKIQPVVKGRSGSSSRDSLLKEVSQDKNGGESVSTLLNEEYAEEAEVASFTDDDGSSHSSLTNGGLHPQENGPERLVEGNEGVNKKQIVSSKLGTEKHIALQENMKEISSCSSSVDLTSDIGSPINAHTSVSKSFNYCSMVMPNDDVAHSFHSSSSAFNYESKEEEANTNMRNNGHYDFAQEVGRKVTDSSIKIRGDTSQMRAGRDTLDKIVNDDDVYDSFMDTGSQYPKEKRNFSEDEPIDTFTQGGSPNEDSCENVLKIDRLKHVKSVRSSSDSAWNNGLVTRNQHNEEKEVGALHDAQNTAGSLKVNERKNAKVYPQDTGTTFLNGKIQQLEHKIKMLEGELREAASVEAALYSVVAEHGSSTSKVHAPARRLSRLYLHACRESSQLRRASAARIAVSGLVLVAKACGNNVPRLTFWLSNSVVLRAIISQSIGDKELTLSGGQNIERDDGVKINKMISPQLKWKQLSSSRKENKTIIYGNSDDWEDPNVFTSALERVEAWIFSRIIESIWWQTLTPHMQSTATKEIDRFIGSDSKKNLGRTSSSGDQDQGNFSLELWKKAFMDACERLCPVRAGRHECGCLPVLARLIMEQCVARLDVAMFNAILRESADEIPTDPLSDPISDSKVLPIPAGKSSFGAGAQLKNADTHTIQRNHLLRLATEPTCLLILSNSCQLHHLEVDDSIIFLADSFEIGNWSRWLTDLFGMDDESLEDDNGKDENDERQDTYFKSFHLLNALSDLMMLPKDMLLCRSIRKEVCPTFGAPSIKRVLDNFVSDEFCPDPIPAVVLEALESEDALEVGENSVTSIPHIAAPPLYLPPVAASIAAFLGEFGSQPQLRRSGSLLRKSYTSDDELDELNSPLASVFLHGSWSSPAPTKLGWKSKEMEKQNSIRYELLRDVWMNSE